MVIILYHSIEEIFIVKNEDVNEVSFGICHVWINVMTLLNYPRVVDLMNNTFRHAFLNVETLAPCIYNKNIDYD